MATGEDAFCVTELKSHYLFGVADGVGGWVSQGVDPSLFSWALMKACSDVAPNTPVVPGLPFSQAVLASAWNKVNKDRKVLFCSYMIALCTIASVIISNTICFRHNRSHCILNDYHRCKRSHPLAACMPACTHICRIFSTECNLRLTYASP